MKRKTKQASSNPQSLSFEIACVACGEPIVAQVANIGEKLTCPGCSKEVDVPIPGGIGINSKSDPAPVAAPPIGVGGNPDETKSKKFDLMGRFKNLIEKRRVRTEFKAKRSENHRRQSEQELEVRGVTIKLGQAAWKSMTVEALPAEPAGKLRKNLEERERLEAERGERLQKLEEFDKRTGDRVKTLNGEIEPGRRAFREKVKALRDGRSRLDTAQKEWNAVLERAGKIAEKIQLAASERLVEISSGGPEFGEAWLASLVKQFREDADRLSEQESPFEAARAEISEAKKELGQCDSTLGQAKQELARLEEKRDKFESDSADQRKDLKSAVFSVEDRLSENSKDADELWARIGDLLFHSAPKELVKSPEFQEVQDAAELLNGIVKAGKEIERQLEQLL